MKITNRDYILPRAIIGYIGFISKDSSILPVYLSQYDAGQYYNPIDVKPIVLSVGACVTIVQYLTDDDNCIFEQAYVDTENIIDGKGFYIYE